jgi:alkylmercury lyase
MDITTNVLSGSAVEIRPGVFRPDWTVVRTPRAREALAGRLAARAGLLDSWALRLEANEDLVWRTIVRLYAERGRPPSRADIVAESGIASGDVGVLVNTLRAHDLIDVDHLGAIKVAYPFTLANTGHRIELRGKVVHALCAIDALGVADMYRTDITIASFCHHCGAAVCVETGSQGKALMRVMPDSAVVWYDFAYVGSAATSCCPAIAFFCSDEHMRGWLNRQNPRRSGVKLTMDEALEVGRAIFGPVLVDTSSMD